MGYKIPELELEVIVTEKKKIESIFTLQINKHEFLAVVLFEGGMGDERVEFPRWREKETDGGLFNFHFTRWTNKAGCGYDAVFR